MRQTQRGGWKLRVLRASVLATLATLAAGAAAHAAQPAKAVLRGYLDGVAGTALMTGNYTGVITQLSRHGTLYLSDALSASTNLCVAYTVTHQFAAAVSECDTAVDLARHDASGSTLSSHAAYDEHLALAYSNRAVLHALMAQPQPAVSDIARAHALAPSADFVSQNVAAIGASAASLPKVVSTRG
jgi:hypothetical protein